MMPLLHPHFIASLIFLTIVFFTREASAGEDYPPIPYPELYDQMWIDPDLALEKVRDLYQQGKEQQDTGLQIAMLLLMVYGYDGLEKQAQFDTALALGIELARKTGDHRNLAYFYSRKAYNINRRGEQEEALALSNQAITIARELGDNRLLGESLADKGLILTEQGAEEAALKELLAAYDIFSRYRDEDNLTVLYSHIGNVYFNLGQYDKAIQFHQKSAASLNEDQLRDLGIIKLNIGAAYTLDKQYTKAEPFLVEARDIFAREDIPASLGLADYWLGALRAGQKAWPAAIDHYTKALAWFSREQHPSMQFNCHSKLARIHLQLNEQSAATEHLESAGKLLDQMNNPTAQFTLTRIKAKLAASRQEYAEAFDLCKTSLEQAEKLHKANSQSKLQRLQVQFESAQKEAENALLKERNKVQEILISSNRSQRNLALIISALVLLLLLATFIGFLQQRRMHRQMAQLAMADELTGAANRRRILQLAQEAFQKARKHPHSHLAIALLDLDHFKRINDRYGHEAGDNALKAFVDVSRKVIRAQDSLGRFGGEEWLLLLPQASAREAREVVNRISEQYAQQPVEGVPEDQVLTFSAGITELRESDTSLDQLLKRADQAMYAAKSAGRNQIVLA